MFAESALSVARERVIRPGESRLSAGRGRSIFRGMKFSLFSTAFLSAAMVSSVPAQQPIVMKESEVVFPGFLGFGRKVDSETLILPGASGVMRQQRVRDRREALQEAHGAAQREQERQAEARRKAEADAMASVAPAPADAASAESAMVEASGESVAEVPAEAASAAATAVSEDAPAAPAVAEVAEEPVAAEQVPVADAAPAEPDAAPAAAEPASEAAPEATPTPE